MADGKIIRWGILGPGGIAKDFRQGVLGTDSGELVAIGTRNPDKPNLKEDFPGVRVHGSYEELIADPEVDAIYVATPHPFHAEWVIKCAEGGKHVLCEKPIGLSAAEADAMIHAAQKAGTFLGEAFMYRLHPQTRKLIDLVTSGTIGEVRMIKSSFGFAMGKFMPEHRLYANDLAGGGIMDVGCYPASMARLIAGAASGKPFLDPVKVSGTAHLGETGVDEWAAALLHFPGDIIAEISCSVSLQQDNVLHILGTEGRIELADFWFAGGKRGGTSTIEIIRPDGSREGVETVSDRDLYAFEAEAAAAAINAGQQEFSAPGMSWADTMGNLRLLDQWRANAGLEFDIEKSHRRTTTIRGDKLKVGANTIPRKQIQGVSKPTSLVALGFENFKSFSAAAIMLDAFFERGGNLYDTAHIYGGGMTETQFGQWHSSRGVREDCVVIGKGAHSPLVYPDIISKQLDVSLDRLQTDYVDIYFMHRDNLEVPVGEFVDAMDAEVKRGRIRGPFGGSNWTKERMQEAIDYAKANGKTPPSALSNNFSLAEMINPIWAGCISASDDAYKAWLTENQIVNFSWSSQARGFFTDRAGRDKTDNAELVNTWYSEKNFERRDRAVELARELDRSPIHVALAYVLAQPFPSVPLIGPRLLWELDDSLSALDIQLTPDQVRWLESGK